MNNNKSVKYDIDKNFIVAKDNKLIYSKYDMSSLEQKLVLVLASTIKPNDDNINRVTFKVTELAELMDVTPQLLYGELQKITKKIMSRVVEIKSENGDWELLHMISYAKYQKKQGLITLEFHKEMKPYLLQLKELYTSYKLDNILSLNSKYAIRLYELLKGNSFKGTFVINLETFKELLLLNQKAYDSFSNINLKILKPSIKEIEEKTDLRVKFTPQKIGRKVTGLHFGIKLKAITPEKEIKRSGFKSEANTGKQLKFANFTQRDYDYDDLEKSLLGWK